MTMQHDPNGEQLDRRRLEDLVEAIDEETPEELDELLTDLLVHTYLSVEIQNA